MKCDNYTDEEPSHISILIDYLMILQHLASFLQFTLFESFILQIDIIPLKEIVYDHNGEVSCLLPIFFQQMEHSYIYL